MKPLLKFVMPILLLGSGDIVMAQDRLEFSTFNAENNLNFPADRSLSLGDVATIEVWVKPQWEEDLGYNPAILSAIGPQGVHYAVVMTDDKQAMGLYSGDEWDYIEMDFDDGYAHHVAFVVQGDLTDVYVDGEHYDILAQNIEPLPISTFHLGSLDGIDGTFIGDLAGVRIWNTALLEEEIDSYKALNLSDEQQNSHPDGEFLVGVSDFSLGSRSFRLLSGQEDQDILLSSLLRGNIEVESEEGNELTDEIPTDIDIDPDVPEEDQWLEDEADIFAGLADEVVRLQNSGEWDAIMQADTLNSKVVTDTEQGEIK